MNKIEIGILHEAHESPVGMMLFLAKLTQRGEKISTMNGLLALYNSCVSKEQNVDNMKAIAELPHGTIKRFTPITIAVVGASRRFLAQARTHQIGINFVSASLQYSDYSGKSEFVVPYELLNPDIAMIKEEYLKSCNKSMETYENLIKYDISNDTAGYAAPQSLRNILILQANHEAWAHFIRTRACSRNTNETQNIALRIWDLLLNDSKNGKEFFSNVGPDCTTGCCREGKMSCGRPLSTEPMGILKSYWPLLYKEN